MRDGDSRTVCITALVACNACVIAHSLELSPCFSITDVLSTISTLSVGNNSTSIRWGLPLCTHLDVGKLCEGSERSQGEILHARVKRATDPSKAKGDCPCYSWINHYTDDRSMQKDSVLPCWTPASLFTQLIRNRFSEPGMRIGSPFVSMMV